MRATPVFPRCTAPRAFALALVAVLALGRGARAGDVDFGLDDVDPGKKTREDEDLLELTGEKSKKALPKNLYFYATFDETYNAIQGGQECFSSMSSMTAGYEEAPVGKGAVLRQTLGYPEEKGFPLREGTMAFWLKPQDSSFMIFGKLTRTEPARGDLNAMRIGYGTYNRDKSVPVFDVLTTDCEGWAGRSGLQADMPIWKPGMWKHVAVVWTRAGFQIWIDGEKLAEYDEGAYTPDEHAKSFALNPWGRSTFTIDDFRIYSCKLQEQEIKELVAMGDRKVIKAAQLKAAKNIGQRCIVFFDRRFIDDMQGVRLKMHPPRPAEVALRLDKPWEGPFSFGFSMFRYEGKCRLYYRTAGADPSTMVMCCAESEDGIRWTKPEYAAAEYKGSRSNNLIADEQGHPIPNLHVFLDARPNVSSGKIKGFYFRKAEAFRDFLPSERGHLRAVFLSSNDGITFRPLERQPRLLCSGGDPAGTFATLFWSDAEESYVCYHRSWNQVYTLTRTSTRDFLRWPRSRGSMGFGTGDSWHIWTSGLMPYPRAPEVYLALAGRMRPGVQVLTQGQVNALKVADDAPFAVWEDSSDCVFMTSEPGSVVCNREFQKPLVCAGPDPENCVVGSNLPVPGLIETGPQEYSFFLSRQYAQPGWHLQRFVVRKDGFVSVHADAEGGKLVTKPFRFTGSRLEINCVVAAAGEIRVAIEDATEEGRIIPGFSADDCLPVKGDGLTQVVRWKGGSDLAELAEQSAIHLHFIMKDADLYSFRFATE